MSKKRKSSKEQPRYEPPVEQEPEASSEPKYRVKTLYLLDPVEVAELIAASSAPFVDPPKSTEVVLYDSYSMEEVLALQEGKPYRRKRKKK